MDTNQKEKALPPLHVRKRARSMDVAPIAFDTEKGTEGWGWTYAGPRARHTSIRGRGLYSVTAAIVVVDGRLC